MTKIENYKVCLFLFLFVLFLIITSCGDSSSSSNEDVNKCGNISYNPETHFCDDRNGGFVYKKVTIAPKGSNYSRTWMAENLNYATDEGSFCNPKIENSCNIFGRFYLWYAAVGKTKNECGYGHKCNLKEKSEGFVRGVCPKGWHLPNDVEWSELIAAVGGDDLAGKMLKSDSGWHKDKSGNVSGNGIDAYGFSALSAGFRDDEVEDKNNGDFFDDYDEEGGWSAFFWSSTEIDEYVASNVHIHTDNEALLGDNKLKKSCGLSIRCVKDFE